MSGKSFWIEERLKTQSGEENSSSGRLNPVGRLQQSGCLRMWDMSNCTYMASGDRRFSGIFFDLYFISITFEKKFKVFKVFSDMSLVIRRLF